MSNFWQRAITGTVFVFTLVGGIILGGWYLFGLFGLIVALGLHEFYGMFKDAETRPQQLIGTILGTAIYFLGISALLYGNPYLTAFVGILFTSFILIGAVELFRNQARPFENIAVTMTGMIYLVIPFLLLSYLSIRTGVTGSLDYNFWPVLTVFILIWCNDTFAYLTGRLLGKHKLFERISPKKTKEGFIGGLVFAVLGGILIAYFTEGSYLKLSIYAIFAGVVGTLGDLVESMLKRSLNLKDSGNILPGHGGILDRFDAVIFVVPVIFVLEKFVFIHLS